MLFLEYKKNLDTDLYSNWSFLFSYNSNTRCQFNQAAILHPKYCILFITDKPQIKQIKWTGQPMCLMFLYSYAHLIMNLKYDYRLRVCVTSLTNCYIPCVVMYIMQVCVLVFKRKKTKTKYVILQNVHYFPIYC